jgi:hypothetical protein
VLHEREASAGPVAGEDRDVVRPALRGVDEAPARVDEDLGPAVRGRRLAPPGIAATVWYSVRRPSLYLNAVTVTLISLRTYTSLPSGEKAKWRGRTGARRRHTAAGPESAPRSWRRTGRPGSGPGRGRPASAKRFALSVSIMWPCGPFWRLGSATVPACWTNDEAASTPPSRANGQAGHAAAAVVRDEHVAAASVHDEVAGRGATRTRLGSGHAGRPVAGSMAKRVTEPAFWPS